MLQLSIILATIDNKKASSICAQFMLFKSLNLFFSCAVFFFLPRAYLLAYFFLTKSNRYNSFPISYFILYLLKERAQQPKPKMKKATNPPIIPKVDTNFQLEKVQYLTRQLLAKDRLQLMLGLLKSLNYVQNCWNYVKEYAMSLYQSPQKAI